MRGNISSDVIAEKVKENGLEQTIMYDINSCDIEDEDLSTMWLEAKAILGRIDEYLDDIYKQQY